MRIKFVRVEEGKKTGSNPKATGITVGAAVPNPKKSPEQVQSQIARIKGKVQARAETKAGEVAHNKVMSQPGEHRISAGRVARSAGNKAGRRFEAGVKTGGKVKLPATISKSRGGGKGEIVKKVLLTKGARRAIANRGNRVGRHGYSVPSRGRRIPTEVTMGEQNSSTEIFGNKIVEGFNRLLNEGGVSNWLAQGAKQALTHAGDVASSNISRGLPKIKQGIKTGAGWLAKKAMYGAGKLTGMAIRGGKALSKKYAKENSSTEILGNKIVESFDRLLNEGGKSSPKRIANRRERQAVKKGMFNLGSAQRMATQDPRRNDAKFRRRSKAAAKAILNLDPGEEPRKDAEEVIRRTRS